MNREQADMEPEDRNKRKGKRMTGKTGRQGTKTGKKSPTPPYPLKRNTSRYLIFFAKTNVAAGGRYLSTKRLK